MDPTGAAVRQQRCIWNRRRKKKRCTCITSHRSGEKWGWAQCRCQENTIQVTTGRTDEHFLPAPSTEETSEGWRARRPWPDAMWVSRGASSCSSRTRLPVVGWDPRRPVLYRCSEWRSADPGSVSQTAWKRCCPSFNPSTRSFTSRQPLTSLTDVQHHS